MKTKLLLILIAVVIVAAVGCSQMNPMAPLNILSTVYVGGINGVPGDFQTTLFAGQDIEAGTLTISIIDSGDSEDICFTYDTTDGWELIETHLWLGEDLADMPQNRKGNPQIGLFPYGSSEFDDPTYWEKCVNLNEWGYGEGLDDADLCNLVVFAAAHAALGKDTDGDGEYDQFETGWGNGDRMVERGNWATYFTVELSCYPGGGGGGQGETAFAYDCGDYANCFIGIDEDGDGAGDFNRWGWSNGPLSGGTYYFDIYAGAGQCDITKGTLVGLLTVEYYGSTATVTYNTGCGYTMDEVHLYVGNDILPTDNNPADPGWTVAPGKFPYTDDDIDTDEYTFTVDGLTGDIYVVAHAVVVGDYTLGDCGERGCVPPEPPCTQYGMTWADFSGMPTTTIISSGSTALVGKTLCDGKTVDIQATNISSPQFNMNGGGLPVDLWLEEHSVYGDVNSPTTTRMNTRCLDGNGSATAEMPNSYTLTWDFGDTPLDHTNLFFIGQFWRPENVLTMTAYGANGETVANTVFGYDDLDAQAGTYTFFEPLTWDASTGKLYKGSAGDGPNSGYGFFSIPEGTEIGKIVFDVNDTRTTGTADELNWGIGCFGCIQ